MSAGFSPKTNKCVLYRCTPTHCRRTAPPLSSETFLRMDGRAYGLKGSLAAKAAQSTGIAVLFTTNSRTIRAKWHTSNLRVVGTNTGANCQKGLDLYIRKKGKWLFAGVGAPNMKGNCADHEAILVASMDEDVKECLLYLSTFRSGRPTRDRRGQRECDQTFGESVPTSYHFLRIKY